jgi:hypothetical protein
MPAVGGRIIDAAQGAKKLDNALDAGSAARRAPAPNAGKAKPHGGTAHDQAIDNRVGELSQDPSVTNIRKNQAQVDVDGNKAGGNRPDVQFDRDGTHHNVEYDHSSSASKKHGETIKKNDPKSTVELNKLEKNK